MTFYDILDTAIVLVVGMCIGVIAARLRFGPRLTKRKTVCPDCQGTKKIRGRPCPCVDPLPTINVRDMRKVRRRLRKAKLVFTACDRCLGTQLVNGRRCTACRNGNETPLTFQVDCSMCFGHGHLRGGRGERCPACQGSGGPYGEKKRCCDVCGAKAAKGILYAHSAGGLCEDCHEVATS